MINKVVRGPYYLYVVQSEIRQRTGFDSTAKSGGLAKIDQGE